MGALDSLHHNPLSTTAQGPFHGTGISLFQSPTKSNMGRCRDAITLPSTDTETSHSLPDSFSTVPAVAIKPATVAVPEPEKVMTMGGDIEEAKMQERRWLEPAIELMKNEYLEKGDNITWSAYYASLQDDSLLDNLQPALAQLLPLFYEKVAKAAMIKLGMDVQRQAT